MVWLFIMIDRPFLQEAIFQDFTSKKLLKVENSHKRDFSNDIYLCFRSCSEADDRWFECGQLLLECCVCVAALCVQRS